jgi:predicted dehydrogenase
VGATGIATQGPREAPPPLKNEVRKSHAAALALIPRTEVVGICDLVPELLDQFQQTWGDRWPNAHLYTDYRKMLAEEDLDILTVAIPDNLHAGVTVDGANAGVKGILCEKPLATSLEDADRMIDACEANGVALNVDHTARWGPIYHKVRDTIRAGAIGKLSTIVVTVAGPRAMLFRNGTHLIDGACFFAESDPSKVFACLEEGFEDWDRYKGDGGKLPENEPGASGFILFQNGVRCVYSGTKNTMSMYSLQLSGPDGQIYFVYDAPTAQLLTRDPVAKGSVRHILRPDHYQVQGLVAAYEEMIDIIEEGGASISSAREARKTVQIMVGFLMSQQQGSRLVDIPV